MASVPKPSSPIEQGKRMFESRSRDAARHSVSDSLFIKTNSRYPTYFENVAGEYEQHYRDAERTQPLYRHERAMSPRMVRLPEHNLCNSPQNKAKKSPVLHDSQLLQTLLTTNQYGRSLNLEKFRSRSDHGEQRTSPSQSSESAYGKIRQLKYSGYISKSQPVADQVNYTKVTEHEEKRQGTMNLCNSPKNVYASALR